MKLRILINWAIIVVITLILLEITLRVQQSFGPIYDLKFERVDMDGLSDIVNHKPLRKNVRKFSNASMYGELNGYEYSYYYDSNGIRENSLRSQYEQGNKGVKILFMGDSFIEGYDDSNTLPQHVWAYLRNKGLAVNVYNAGFYSYSSAIFVPQSKQIIPKLDPDFVVVDIDETDLGDDFIRYRKLILRDENGKNIGVKTSPLFYEYNYGLLRVKEQPFYIIKFLQALYHTKIHMPAFKKKYRSDSRHVLSFSRDKSDNAKDKYQEEIAFFRSNVSELAETLIDLMGDRQRILFLYHPHLQHLQPDSNGQYWNDFVSTTINEVAEAYNISFYNASNDLSRVFNENPQDYYWKGKNIHFNFRGLKVYGDLVAKRLLTLIKNTAGLNSQSDKNGA